MTYTLASAQADTIRYVKPTAKGGAYANNGRSWATAKDNIQDAINDLHTYMTLNGLHGGSVYVASGTYEPSEGVEGGTSGQLSTSFIIYEGIHLYGGFNADNPEPSPDKRILTRMDRSKDIRIDTLAAGDTTVVRWQMKYPTVLSGNHNATARSTFRWNSTRKQYETRFPGNSYHVVWFATNGFISDANHPGYADTLRYQAILDGFTVQDGNASGATDVRQGGRDHTSMGGGIYMVKGSLVQNCIIQRCSAAMRGGGVYMDGGGSLLHSLVRECQTLGSGVSGGYGGGVCIDNNGDVHRSWITRNVARMGGGAAIISYPENHPRGSAGMYLGGSFDPYISATIVSNNTSTTEAGGVYLDRGGVVNHVTITRNENTGRDISYGRTRYGRSGGVYIYGAGQVYNSVVWGNVCAADNDIQYAATTGVSIPSYVNLKQPFIGYTALNNLDITDFTGTVRMNAYSFETDNNDINRSGNFTLFMNPPATAGAGIPEQNLRVWYPYSKTSLSVKAVQLAANYSTQAFSVMSIAREDLFDKQFDPISTLGAIETDMEDIHTAMVAPVNAKDAGTTEKIPTLFVNPNRVFNDPSHTSGASWNDPLDNINEAIEYFREHKPANGKFQILVKQGSLTSAGIGAYYNLESNPQSVVTMASIRMIPDLLLYGGFPSSLTDTTIEGRNPKDYPTRISGNIISAGYQNNAMHVVSFSQAKDAVLDGFQIYYGNAQNTNSESAARGGGIVIGNQYYQQSDRIDMTGNVVRNCVIANCSGPQGAAVFVGGSYIGANGSPLKAGLTMENCVINNNEGASSIIHASGDASVSIDHCTFIGNVGPLLATSSYNGVNGSISISNSAFHGNATTPISLVNSLTASDVPTLMVGANITASNNLIDTLYVSDYPGFSKVFSYNPNNVKSYPSFANPVRNVGVAYNTDDNTVYGGSADYTPLDMNPVVNRATKNSANHSSWGTDLTTQVSRDYGGAPDVGALECHQAASTNDNGGQPTYGTVFYVRDYNTYDANGNVLTADDDTTGRDGTSWATAINGNAVYSVDTVYHDYTSTSDIIVSSSVEAAEYKYKLGLSNLSGGNRYYAVGNANGLIRNTTNFNAGDEFVFLTAGDNTYYIFDYTLSKYVTYSTLTRNQPDTLWLSNSNASKATWRFYSNGDGSYGIVPGETTNINGNTLGWNYYGGFGNPLGLYNISGTYSKWQLWIKSTELRIDRGLQYAVDQAAKARGTSTNADDNIEVWASQGIYTNTSRDTVNSQYYGFRMAEGVDVYGGFPNYGNPSKNERSPKVYVSVLQPRNEDPTSDSDSLITNSSKSVARVLVQPHDFGIETEWDGFTIRYGFLHSAYRNNIQGNIASIRTEKIGNSGGAGAFLMEKGVLENCELLNNVILVDPSQENKNLTQIKETVNGGFHQAGAGAYITTTDSLNGTGGTLKNCVVAYNQLKHKFGYTTNEANPESAWMYGAGVYQNKGIIYNTIIHDNSMEVIPGQLTGDKSNQNTNEVLVGAGAFLVKGQFYNNTIVHNTAKTIGTNGHSRHILIPGIYVYQNITMYNSIVSDNTSSHVNDSLYVSPTGQRNVYVVDVPVCAFALRGSTPSAIFSTDEGKVRVRNSYININRDDKKNLCDDNGKDYTNIYLDYNKENTHSPAYTSAEIYDSTTFSLVGISPCVNAGTEDIDSITIPSYDAAYANRVQDCAIDIGAYEYNGAELISPRESKEPHNYYVDDEHMARDSVDLAEYFVTQNGSGDASANSPANAACASKLQKVLDAAGRYKYLHPATHVVIRLEALPDSAGYTPSRSAATSASEVANPRSYSIIVPRGVELQGGWRTNSDFGIDSVGKLHGRDPINNITRLTGEYVSGIETVNVYHIVTFTDDVFDENGNPTGQHLSDKVEEYTPDFVNVPVGKDFNDAKLDGLYIEGGRANGTSEADQRGAAAVLTSYSHVTDCIVRDNQASGYGGAFYMMPGSIVEGCVIEGNQAAYGGAIAVAETQSGDSVNRANWALLLSNTISANTATTRGGGLWFNDNARTWNSVYWNNTSAEQNDISGITTTTNEQNLVNCPVNFCAVTSQTIPGNNNISLSPNNARGARWGRDPNLKVKHNYDFYMPSRASMLTRTGLPYNVMRSMIRFIPGCDSLDLAGVSRLQYTEADVQMCDTAYDGEKLVVKYNYNMEIGARALNQSFSVNIDPNHPLYRLYVAHSENMVDSLANTLMESGDPVYSQQGSSFANPFLRLTDALNYIVDARKNYPSISQNKRFEVFVSEGTYYPYADMMGEQTQVRSHTFVVPEMVSIFGGIDARDSGNLYCQDDSDGDKVTIGNITLIGASTDSIRLKRERYDLNQNSVVEPWEMQHATILSGYTEGADLTVKNVYHVITSIADTTVVGKQPFMYSDNDLKQETTDRTKESHYSRGNRAIIIDGITIADGAAMNYEGSSVRNHSMYFRGGGIFVAGDELVESNSSWQYTSDMSQGRRDIPLVISNSLFQNNQARQGGAIFSDGVVHVIGSSFVQNLAVSPSAGENEDLQYVSFSGGGAIATNDTVLATNTIFANNEARDGGDNLTIDRTGTAKRINISNNGKDANDIRAYGGVIWAGDSAAVRLINCDFVRNKAKAFPSIYNCTPNKASEGVAHPHFGINCVFWGNEVEAGQDSSLINYGDSARIGALYFSAYQQGRGVDPTVSETNVNYQRTLITNYQNIYDLDDLLGHANHNVIINGDNDAVNGPNFTLPSNEAGVDGYMSSADWVPSRVNALTDAGWGMIKQDSTGVFLKEHNPDFPDSEEDTYLVYGIYGWLSDFYRREYNMTLLPLADEKYMVYADQTGDEGSTNMERISSDPLGTVTEDYIDIGVYEYQHRLLHIADGDEVDELWVSDSETTGNNDGRSFDSPTSDLQRAIQTLLLSRNNHPKVIHVMQGTYMPIYELDNGDIGFVITTAPNVSSVAMPEMIATGREYKATSLTIMGGYSKEIEGLRDVSLYPTVLRMNRRDYATDANTAHLFYISNAEQWSTSGSQRTDGSESGSAGQSVPSSSVSKTSLSHGTSLPVVLDGLTFVNTYANANHKDLTEDGSSVDPNTSEAVATAGAAIYYREQFKSVSSSVTNGTPDKSSTDHLVSDNDVPKLTIRNCKFTQNGYRENGSKAATSVPTVYIGKGGGRTLIYNSLFTNNTGAPIISMDTVDIVNCTFAHNGGHITIKGDGKNVSSLSNSLIWQDDSAVTENAVQYEGFPSDSVRYNAVTGISNTNENDNNHNVGLSDTNSDPMNGPNFVNISTTGGQSLDFSINPGMRTMNRADSTIYKQKIAIIRNGVNDDEGNVIFAADTTWRNDLSWGNRIYGAGLDRGAYECRIQQQRVLYVIPTKTFGTMTGTSWENAYGRGQLQRAIDAAAIYSYSQRDGDNNQPMAYVLVKGESNNTSEEGSITLRDGVSVYGSVPDDYLESITGTRALDDNQLKGYIDTLLAVRPGIASRSTRRSRIMGVQTLDGSYNNGSLLDGFEVWSPTALSQAVVNVTKPVVLSKLIIHGTTVNGSGQPAINMDGGLMYNCLVYDNVPSSGQPVMNLSKDGAVVNSTLVSNRAEVTALKGEGLLANSITYGFNADQLSGDVSREGSLDTIAVNRMSGIPFAPYLTAGVNPYRLSSYITGFAPYQYQLNESSEALASGDSLYRIMNAAQAHTTSTAPYEILNMAQSKGWINFDTDCDLLGNNRRLGRLIDEGCFETWHILPGNDITATAENYPHEGSVVYLMDNSVLSLGDNQDEQVFTQDNPFRPAFLLVRPGASLYGNGNVILLSYVAAETEIDASSKYHLLSFPFAYKIGDMLQTSIGANRQIDAKHFTLKNAQTYNGQRRAQWNYHFNQDESECWEKMDTTQTVPANTGWLITVPDTITGRITLRLVGYGQVDGDYVYTEYGTPKTVSLTQYDERPNDGSAHFTKEENMGWNMTGLPYLVSNYKLGSNDDGYNMNVPHMLYYVNDDATFSTLESWSPDAVLSFGNGVMTQTAVNGNTETVTFAVPVKDNDTATPNNVRQAITLSSDNDERVEDVLQLNASENAKSLQYTLGSDGVKWLPLAIGKPSMYALTAGGTPLSLSSATPMETDIPVVVTGKLNGESTIAIEDTVAFNGVSHVWLRDETSGKVVDLKEEPLHIYSDSTANDSNDIQVRNLTLRIGGVKMDGANGDGGSNVHIYVSGRTLHVDGVNAGDRIDIYTISGQLYRRVVAEGTSYTCELIPGVFVVRANGKGRAVAVRY